MKKKKLPFELIISIVSFSIALTSLVLEIVSVEDFNIIEAIKEESYALIIAILSLLLFDLIIGLKSNDLSKLIRRFSHKKRIFLSFCLEDKEIAESISSSLRKSGAKVWDWSEQINLGQNWSDSVNQALSSTDTFITIISKNISNSQLMEIEKAKALDIPIIPVLIQKAKLPSAVSDYSWIELSDNCEEGIEKIVDAST